MQITINGTKFLHIDGDDSTIMVVQGIRQKNPENVPGYRQDEKQKHVYRKITDGNGPAVVTQEPKEESSGRIYSSELPSGDNKEAEEVLPEAEKSELGVAVTPSEEEDNSI